jgi:hypothetical protein
MAATVAPLVRGQGSFGVRFDSSSYTTQPGGTIPVSVVIDPAPGNGLFSYGVSVNFDPARALVELVGIEVPPELDFNGVAAGGALRAVADGVASVKGTVDFSVLPIPAYKGSLLASFLVTDRLGVAGSSTPLGLSLFRTLGPGETIFVDGSGRALDDKILFGSATITVIPEPGVLSLLLFGCIGGSCRFCLRASRAGRAAGTGLPVP